MFCSRARLRPRYRLVLLLTSARYSPGECHRVDSLGPILNLQDQACGRMAGGARRIHTDNGKATRTQARAGLECTYRAEDAGVPGHGVEEARPSIGIPAYLTPASANPNIETEAAPPSPAQFQPLETSSLEQEIRNLRARIQRLEASGTRTSLNNNVSTTQNSKAGQNEMPRISPRLRISSVKTKYFGATHWLNAAQRVS